MRSRLEDGKTQKTSTCAAFHLGPEGVFQPRTGPLKRNRQVTVKNWHCHIIGSDRQCCARRCNRGSCCGFHLLCRQPSEYSIPSRAKIIRPAPDLRDGPRIIFVKTSSSHDAPVYK